MHLKRLESVGFKSFAERINVEFVPGVTAVVGPNGSGKSNITDAIRWVLGEQSAKSLRGSKMEDIIFQGSDTRNALNVAEVTLVLDNQDEALPLDYEEVSVTRRVYRSGESEFYINKQSCRLKDIIDLFMDSGLGREAFSIISQGKVEEILSSKAEERRTIFEEAAGVLKYKQRKKKAEYKLAETQENLNRVEDIIHEIDQQMEPLEEQAETAKTYKRLKAQLKEEEISLLITEIESLHDRWQSLSNKLESDKNKEIAMKTEIQQKEAKLEKERQEIQQLDEAIDALQEQLLTSTQSLEKYEGKKRLFNERTKHFTENKQKLETQKEETAKRIGRLHEEVTAENKKLHDLTEVKSATSENVKQLKSRLTADKQDIADKLEELKSEYIEELNEQAAKRNEKQSIQQQLTQLTGKTDRQTEKFEGLLQSRKELNRQGEELKHELNQQEKACEEKEDDIRKLKEELKKMRAAFQESQAKQNQGYQYIEKLKSKKEMLEEMKDDFQGFFHGVKAVLKAREDRQLTNIHGAVIELMDIPKKYLRAMESVLGGQAQHIVVDDDQAARQAIAWLKKTNSGRATFLPLASIQERFVTRGVLADIESHPGFIGDAASLIDTHPDYQKAVKHLMGHVLIATELKSANEIARLSGRRYRVVTLEGDVVNPGGSISGGAQKKTGQSLFTREKDLQEVTEKLKDFQAKMTNFEKNVQNQEQQISEKEKLLTKEEEAEREENEKLADLRNVSKELDMKLRALNDNLTLYDQDKQQYDEDRQTLNEREERLNTELNELKEKLEAMQSEINGLTEQESAWQENKQKLETQLHEQQVTLAEQEERVKNQRERARASEEELQKADQQYNSVHNDLQELEEMHHSEETEEEMEETIARKKQEKAAFTAEIQEKRAERSTRTRDSEDQERELKEENKKHQQFIQNIQQREVQVNRLDVDLENRLSHLQTEYTITYEKASQLYDKAEDPEAAKSAVNELKQKIDRLGTVNLGAIEEFDRITERHDFLIEQKNDLVDAKETLFAVIAEMDEEMITRFDDTFKQIKEEFAHVFRQLFGGGRAELKLTDPNNLLDTGVDIDAQPPGKKLQHLGLLSGGERALTAIALLFAILRVRPVPFCVLDEVEAALDEANVTRFAKYVRLYSEKTQFIVITHRKGTMEESDVLYGVTMQESGVSRLVSVRLEETKELIES
ncbi:chromosome segregation protein SMC [Lentibacillus sediminis]|uniref:chromosome segregation protein SMC n=1 Tax=Lentibacillus sediminis TaxID=1940529 RepID=UPI000C1C78D0|nr:chromosome segregation protein SMC [Lentibacillus sediminis]